MYPLIVNYSYLFSNLYPTNSISKAPYISDYTFPSTVNKGLSHQVFANCHSWEIIKNIDMKETFGPIMFE